MKTQIALALGLLLIIGCAKNSNDIEPQTPTAGTDYFKFQYGSEWTLIEAKPNVTQVSEIDCPPKKNTTIQSISMSKTLSQSMIQTIGFEFIGQSKAIEVGRLPLVFSRTGLFSGIEFTLQQPRELGYVTLKTTNTIQPNDSFFEITDIAPQNNTKRISGKFMAVLNNGEKIKGSFRMTIPKLTIN